MGSKLVVFLSVLLYILNSAISGEAVTAKTQNGDVLGKEMKTVNAGKSFWAFRGIPYAEAPTGNRRFEPPVEKAPWTGVLDATEDKEICTQGFEPSVGSEDCLHINVYTTKSPEPDCQNPLPVFVWIYGGAFTSGDASYTTLGPDYILEQDILVVTFNYRVGVLGFASTGDSVVPGNNGLKDQLLALQWVNKNIRNFCGDPNKVTLAGQSAGSASVAFHLQSKKSSGLFQKAILQSGTSLNLWSRARNIPELLKRIAAEAGVGTSSSSEIITGLRQLNSSFLQHTATSIANSAILEFNPRDGGTYAPVVEPETPDAIFTGNSYGIMSQGDYNAVPILIGFTSLEGGMDFSLAFRLFFSTYDSDKTKLIPMDMNVQESKRKEVGNKIKSHYWPLLPVSMSTESTMNFMTDDQFSRPIYKFALLNQKQNVPTYLYRFSYEGGLWGMANRTKSGVVHSEDLGYIWISPHTPASEQDIVVRSRLVTLWTNFVKQGNPTPQKTSLLQNIEWTPVSSSAISYLDIGKDLVLSANPDKRDMDFWEDLYQKYSNGPLDTY